MTNKLKNGLFICGVIVLCLPAIQHKFRFLYEQELKGHVNDEPKPAFSMKSWFHGDYQSKQEKYLNEKTGFRPSLVRFKNELDFNFFQILHAGGVSMSKDGYLFEESYIQSAQGNDFIGEDSIKYKVKLLRQLQDKLNQNGIKFVFVFAPGKGLIFQDQLSNSSTRKKTIKTNYDYFIRSFKSEGVNHIDFLDYTKKNHQKSTYALMCKTGIHWSKYMEYVAGDSLFSYMDKKWGMKFPRTVLKKIKKSKSALDTDQDIENSLNLIQDLPDFDNMGYPEFTFDREISKKDPKLLAIADSFYWGIYSNYNTHLLNPTFWYYYKEQYSDNNAIIDVNKLNLKEELLKRKVIVMLFTDSNLKNFGYGFIEDALKALAEK